MQNWYDIVISILIVICFLLLAGELYSDTQNRSDYPQIVISNSDCDLVTEDSDDKLGSK